MTRALEPPLGTGTDPSPDVQHAGTFEEESTALVVDLGRRAPAPRLMSSIVIAVVLGYVVMGFVNITEDGLSHKQIILGAVCFSCVAALQLLHSHDRFADLHRRLGCGPCCSRPC
ncbi:hypothetical protein [Streptacidiphilus sp. PAMC 29251]